jgi:hypothetical protein
LGAAVRVRLATRKRVRLRDQGVALMEGPLPTWAVTLAALLGGGPDTSIAFAPLTRFAGGPHDSGGVIFPTLHIEFYNFDEFRA